MFQHVLSASGVPCSNESDSKSDKKRIVSERVLRSVFQSHFWEATFLPSLAATALKRFSIWKCQSDLEFENSGISHPSFIWDAWR